MAAPIRIKIGASVDQSVQASFTSIIDAAKKARATIESEFKAAGTAIGSALAGPGTRKNPFGQLPAQAKESTERVKRNARETSQAMGQLADGAAAKFKSLADGLKGLPADLKVVSREATKALQAMEREKARAALGIAGPDKNRLYWSAMGGNLQIKKPTLHTVELDPIRGAARFGIGAGRMLMRTAQAAGLETDFGALVGKNVQDEALAQRISSAGYMPGQSGPNGQIIDRGTILGETRKIAIGTGQERGDVLAGLDAFVSKTGDLETGRKSLEDMARLAKATGSNLEDVANAAAEVSNNLGDVPNKGELINRVMRQVGGQGKLGAIEFRDLASQMAKLASVSHDFQGGAAQVIPLMGILAQESKLQGGSASATQAATSIMGLDRGLMKGKTYEHWRAMGLNPFADANETKLKDPLELITDALKATGGNKLKMAQLLPEASGQRGIRGFANIYNEAGGGAKGLAAVTDEFERFRAAQLSTEEVTRALGAAMDTDKSKITVMNEQFAQAAQQIQTGLVPALQSLAPIVLDVATDLSKLLAKFAPDTTGADGQALATDDPEIAKLKKNAHVEYDERGEPVTMYEGADVEALLNRGSKRDALVEKLRDKVKDKGFQGAFGGFGAETQEYETKPTDPIWKQILSGDYMLRAFGGNPQHDADKGNLSRQIELQTKTNEILQRIADGVDDNGGGIVVNRPVAPPPIPTGGTVPADAVTR